MEPEPPLLPIRSLIKAPTGDAYVVEGLLGQGGFSAVYLVSEQQNKQHRFALKDVDFSVRSRRGRLEIESDLLRRLNHPALPHIFKLFEQEGGQRLFLMMEYIEGQSLESLQKEQPAGKYLLPRVLEFIAPIVDALSYLHHQNLPIIHRDVKPGNIIVSPWGRGAVLVDFSIAKEYVADRTTNIIRYGTPGYAAPEQYIGGTTPRTDVYGLGATLYMLLTGIDPPDAILRATSEPGGDPLLPANLLSPLLPAAVDDVLRRALALRSDERFATIEQFWQELTAAASEQPKELATRVPAAPLWTLPAEAGFGTAASASNSNPRRGCVATSNAAIR